jgi:hypothetical protein
VSGARRASRKDYCVGSNVITDGIEAEDRI